MIPAARLALAASTLTLLCLVTLHVVSPEFDPSWRMVSEYANGRHAWILTLFFASWAVGTWAIAAALWPRARTWPARIGLVLMLVSGLGEAFGAAFDVNHPGHGLAFALGVPTWPIATLLVGVSLARHDGAQLLGRVSHAPWISVVLMGASFGLLASSAAKIGLVLDPTKPWHEVPAGVTAIMGWANRLLVVAYVAWTIVAALHVGRGGDSQGSKAPSAG